MIENSIKKVTADLIRECYLRQSAEHPQLLVRITNATEAHIILWVKNDKETGQVVINLYMRRENNRNDRFIKNKIQKIAISNCCILPTH